MKINVIRCDYCHEICEGDSFTAYRNSADGRVVGKSDYCEKCWNKAHTPLPIDPYFKGDRE